MTDPRYHSVAAVIPFLIAATVARDREDRRAAARARCGRRARAPRPRSASSSARGPASSTGHRSEVDHAYPRHAREALAAAVAALPPGVPVSTSNSVGAHVSTRKYVYTVPNTGAPSGSSSTSTIPYVVTPDSPILTHRPRVPRAFAARLEHDPGWTKVRDEAGVLVFRRNG